MDDSASPTPKRPQFFTRECFNSGNMVVVTTDSKENIRIFEFIEKDGDASFIGHSDCTECNFDSFFYKGQKINEFEVKQDDVVVQEKGVDAVKVLESFPQQDDIKSTECNNEGNVALLRSVTDSQKDSLNEASGDFNDENVTKSDEKENIGENRGNWFTQTDDEIEEYCEKEEEEEEKEVDDVVNYRIEKCDDGVDDESESEIEDSDEEISRSINRYAESEDDYNSFTEEIFGSGRYRKAKASDYACYEQNEGLDDVEENDVSEVREIDFDYLKTSGDSEVTCAELMNSEFFKTTVHPEASHEIDVCSILKNIVEDVVQLQNQKSEDVQNFRNFMQEVMEENQRRTQELQKIFHK